MDEQPELLTVAETARRLRVTEETVRRMLRDSRLRGVRLGGTKSGWRVVAESVSQFIRQGGVAPKMAEAA
jgi:excisionase family DNA binding protein